MRLLLDVLLALFYAVVADLLADWSTVLSVWLTRRATRLLPGQYAARYEEEWLETLSTRPRLLRPLFALDLFRASFVIAREYKLERSASLNKLGDLMPIRARIISLLLILVYAPAMLLLAILIKSFSRGPVFVTHLRIQSPGKPDSHAYGFRTEGLPHWLHAFVRQAAIDDLPLLFSTLRGDLPLAATRIARTLFMIFGGKNKQ